MGLLVQADLVALQTMAARFQGLAAEVAAVSAPPASGLSCQATTAAVSAAHAGIGLASETLAARLNATAAKVVTTGVSYGDQDSSSAAGLDAVASATVTV